MVENIDYDSVKYEWVKFYEELADKLCEFKNNRIALLKRIYFIYDKLKLDKSKLMNNNEHANDISPFTVYALISSLDEKDRVRFLKGLSKILKMNNAVPNSFIGYPNVEMFVISTEKNNNKQKIDELWKLLEIGIKYSTIKEQDFENGKEEQEIQEQFKEIFDKAQSQDDSKFQITINLSAIRPLKYIRLNSINRNYLENEYDFKVENKIISADEYIEYLIGIRNLCDNQADYLDILMISDRAYEEYKKLDDTKKAIQNENATHWLYVLKTNAKTWKKFYSEGIICIEKNKVETLKKYGTKEELKEAIKKSPNILNDVEKVAKTYNFTDVMKINDIIFVMNKDNSLLGRGIIKSDYVDFKDDPDFLGFRDVLWLNIGEWSYNGAKPDKDLIEIKNENILHEFINKIEGAYSENGNYWWLNISGVNWSFSDFRDGEVFQYEVENDNGVKKRNYENFEAVKRGDLIIGYETTPIQEIAAICRVEQEIKDNKIKIRKVETLRNPISFRVIDKFERLRELNGTSEGECSLYRVEQEEYDILIDIIREYNPIIKKVKYETYTKQNLLDDIFMNEAEYDTIRKVLLKKKNIILQGVAGTGKTYIAEKLAYSIMNKKDDSKITKIQFYPKLTYKDFVEGYESTEKGIIFERGEFYNICKKAENNPEDNYFFIIDEMNRGNLLDIFGELLMYLENDKRGEKIKLVYSKKTFRIPENLYIIGLFNTLNKTVAFDDYAIIRSFGKYTINPAYDNPNFIKYIKSFKNNKLNVAVKKVNEINKLILETPTLGKNYELGHSYFCNLRTISDEDVDTIMQYEIKPMLELIPDNNVEKSKIMQLLY